MKVQAIAAPERAAAKPANPVESDIRGKLKYLLGKVGCHTNVVRPYTGAQIAPLTQHKAETRPAAGRWPTARRGGVAAAVPRRHLL
jgi:hypothetical protein